MKNIILVLLLSFASIYAQAQQQGCAISIQGKVVDSDTHEAVGHAYVKFDDRSPVLTNHIGEFYLKDLCHGEGIFSISHISYNNLTKRLVIVNDSTITIYLDKKSVMLDAVDIHSNLHNKSIQNANRVSKEQIVASQGKTLAEVLSSIDGVSILKTGSNISKPVLNGLYGNRLLLVNNGVRHESQQWGAEHAPEIDPFAGQEIVVIKNADAVRYGPDALAGIIQINPTSIDRSRKLKSSTALVVNSNGKGGILNTQLEGGNSNFGYRAGLTAKKSGNLKTANYYLGNTGTEELNANLLLDYTWKQSDIQISLSHFGTTLGIFEGAHIGSKEDIIARIAHGRPFETYEFGYSIYAPKQRVEHQVAKINYQYTLNENSNIQGQYSLQRNHRREYDRRRVLEDDVPMADMVLTTQQLELVYSYLNTLAGLSGTLQVNNNTPGTGTTPIIPNFDNHTFGAFVSHKVPFGRKQLELGVRYDYKYFDVAGYRFDYTNQNIDGSLNQYLLTDQKHFNNVSAVAGFTYPFSNSFVWKTNAGLAWRAPSANELYSDGIHHGSGTYEVGDKDLKSEKGIKWVNTLLFNNRFLHANLDVFAQVIDDYIYSQPDPDSTRQTIRGTFPLFQFKQTNAFFYGLDYSMQINFMTDWRYDMGIAIVRAKNTTSNTYLPYIPADRYRHALRYTLPIKRLSDSYIKLEQVFQAKQNRYENGTDFALPPPSYHLFNIMLGTTIMNKKNHSTGIQLNVDNLLNKEYKDYMDRFRYYAHALGRNVSIKINYTF